MNSKYERIMASSLRVRVCLSAVYAVHALHTIHGLCLTTYETLFLPSSANTDSLFKYYHLNFK